MHAARLLTTALMITACAGTALADDGMTVRVLNDTPDDLIVTMVDRTVQPPQAVLSGEVINGNASVSVPIGADASGHGRLSWTAITVGRDMRRCGRGERQGVKEGATIRVFANRRCSSQ